MSIVSGSYFDLGNHSMGGLRAIITFELSAPATHPQVNKSLVSSDRKFSTAVDPLTGEWSMPVFSTEQMPQDRFYKVTAHFLNGADVPVGFDEFPWEIRVPEGVWNFNDLVRDWSSPLAVAITTGVPDQPTAFVLNPVTGDLFRKKA